MEINNNKNCCRFGLPDGKTTAIKTPLCIILGIGFGAVLIYSLITEFYFYQAVIAGILIVPVIASFFIYSPRKSLLALLSFTIPFNPSFHIVSTTSFEFSMGLNFWTSDLIVILIFIYLLISNSTEKERKYNPSGSFWQLGLPLLLWIVIGVFSFIPAVNKNIVPIELVRMLRIFLIFFAVYKLVDKPEDARIIVYFLILAFSIQTLLVIMEYCTGHSLIRLPGEAREVELVGGDMFRSSGSMGHSSNYAKLAALSIPICLAYIFAARKSIWRICVSLILIAGLVALVLTISRAGIIATIFGLSWAFLLISKKTNLQHKEIKIIVLVILLFIGIGLAWITGGDRLISRVKWDYGSASSRPQMFSVAWNVIKKHAFLGVGLNNYTLVAPNYDRTANAISVEFPHPVHNIYLLYAAEMGMPGAIVFIWFLLGTISKAFKHSLDVKFTFDSIILKAIGVGITCSWLQGLIGWGHRSSIVHTSYLAMIAGMLSASSYYYQKSRVDKNIES